MQRRRKKKAAPKNVFGTSSQSTQPAKKSRQIPNQSSKIRRHVAPPSVPGSRTSETNNQSQRPSIVKANITDEKLIQSKTEVIPEEVIPVEIVETNSDFVEEISRDVSLLRSDISVLSVVKVSAERSDMSTVVDDVRSLISRDNSLDV